MTHSNKHNSLKHLPGVDYLLDLAKNDDRFIGIPRSVIRDAIRKALDHIRQEILADIETSTDPDTILIATHSLAQKKKSDPGLSLSLMQPVWCFIQTWAGPFYAKMPYIT